MGIMNKKVWLCILLLILAGIAVFGFIQYTHKTSSTPGPVGPIFPPLTDILPDFPAKLPVPASAQIVGYQHATVNNVSTASFQYISTSSLTRVISEYMQYFETYSWTTTPLPSPAGSQAVTAKLPGKTLLVTAMTNPTTQATMVSLAETTTTADPFPIDFPSEKGFTPANSIATSSASMITYVRDYTSAQTLAVNFQTFTTYFTQNGFHITPGPLNSANSKSMIATKSNQQYQAVFVEDPKTGTVYVDIRLTFTLK
jgi:hypothetical protein